MVASYLQLISLATSIIQNGQLCINSALRDRQLGSAEANVLMFLYTHGDGVKQDDIVAGVEVSKPAISRTIASLQRKGYITRSQDERDHRAYIVKLSDRALREKDFIQQQYAELVTVAAGSIPEAQIADFLALFQQVADNLEQYRRHKLSE
ncbi:MAG: MarR family winged helix-turn-helix transcriptional regulator [Chloroflexota bacterium]